jgi:hypothetical protein
MVRKKFVSKTPEERKKEMDEHYQKLVDGVNSVIGNPEDYKRYLDFSSKFPRRSFRNQLLIYMQRPDASWVAGLKTWNKFGRKVNKGAESIKIFAPIMGKEKEIDKITNQEIEKTVIKGFKLTSVFDANDTNGVPLPMHPLVPKDVKETEFAIKTFFPLINDLKQELPIILDKDYSRAGNGYYSSLEHKIVINANENRDLTNQYKTLIHEYAHSVFHNQSGKYYGYDRETKEVQAESMAYLVSKSFGMDTSDYSFLYIKGWAESKDEKILLDYQDDIQKESAALIKKIEDVIIEHEITFDVPVILETNMASVVSGEKPLSLIQFGDHYSIVAGEFKDSDLNNLESIKALGYNFKTRERAYRTFELIKGHIPLHDLEQADSEKGSVHIYKRNLVDPKDNQMKTMYLVGVASITNVKALTESTTDLKTAELALHNLLKEKTINRAESLSESKQIEKTLATRDCDKDGMTDLQEMRMGTNPLNPDTDGDSIPDNIDVHNRKSRKKAAVLEITELTL